MSSSLQGQVYLRREHHRMGREQRHEHGRHVPGSDLFQPTHRGLERFVGHQHDLHVFRGFHFQSTNRSLGYLEGYPHGIYVFASRYFQPTHRKLGHIKGDENALHVQRGIGRSTNRSPTGTFRRSPTWAPCLTELLLQRANQRLEHFIGDGPKPYVHQCNLFQPGSQQLGNLQRHGYVRSLLQRQRPLQWQQGPDPFLLLFQFQLEHRLVGSVPAPASLTNANFQTAVNLWCTDKATAFATYGHIKDWSDQRGDEYEPSLQGQDHL